MDEIVINGVTYDLSAEDQRAKLAANVATAEELVIEGAVVFRPGWNRNGIAPHPKQLSKYAKTAKGTPVLFAHDDHQILGVSQDMIYEEGKGLIQAMRFDKPQDGSQGLMQRMLGLRIAPRFSISWMPGETSEWECSECHKDMRDVTKPYEERCHHYPGQRLSTGGTVQALITDSTHAETSVTFSPAVPGTGLESSDDLERQVAELRDRKLVELSAHADGLARTALAAEQARATALQVERDRLQAVEDDRVVTDLRRRKGLTGDHAGLLTDYQRDRELVRRVLSRVPDSQISQILSTPPPQCRDEDLTPTGVSAADQLAAEVDRLCRDDPKRDRAATWRELRPRYNI